MNPSFVSNIMRFFDLPIFRSLFGIDLRGLAVFRICLGYILLCDLLIRFSDIGLFYTDSGVNPRSLLLTYYGATRASGVSIHLASGEWWFQAFLLIIAIGAAVSLIVGYKTRWMTLLSWYLLISISWRNPRDLNGGDQLLLMLLLWSVFLPLGALYSIDSRRQNKKLALPPTFTHLSIGSAAILIQVILVYFIGAVSKTGDSWIFGDALQHALRLDYFARPTADMILRYPTLTTFLTHATLILEYVGPVLLLFPFKPHWFRPIGILSFAALHLGIASVMSIGLFPFIDIVSLIPFIPSRIWDLFIPPTQDLTAPRTPSLHQTERPTRIRPGMLLSNLLALILLTSTLWWLVAVYNKKVSLPVPIRYICKYLRLGHNWEMFAKISPSTRDGWIVIMAELSDGTKIDLYRDGRKVSWSKPKSISSEFKNNRQQHYLMRMTNPDTPKAFIARYCAYTRRVWNERLKNQGLNIERIKFYFMEETSTGYYDRDIKIKPRLLYTLE